MLKVIICETEHYYNLPNYTFYQILDRWHNVNDYLIQFNLFQEIEYT